MSVFTRKGLIPQQSETTRCARSGRDYLRSRYLSASRVDGTFTPDLASVCSLQIDREREPPSCMKRQTGNHGPFRNAIWIFRHLAVAFYYVDARGSFGRSKITPQHRHQA